MSCIHLDTATVNLGTGGSLYLSNSSVSNDAVLSPIVTTGGELQLDMFQVCISPAMLQHPLMYKFKKPLPISTSVNWREDHRLGGQKL